MNLNQSKGRFLKWRWVARWLPTLPGFYKSYSLILCFITNHQFPKGQLRLINPPLFTLLLLLSLSRTSSLSWGQISHIYLYSSLCGDRLLFRHTGSNWVSFTYMKIQTLSSLASVALKLKWYMRTQGSLSACTSDWVIPVLQYKYGVKEITIQRYYCSPFIFNFPISFTIGISSLELPNNCSDIHLSNSLLYETSVLLWAKLYLCWKSSFNLKLTLLAESLFQVAAHTNSSHICLLNSVGQIAQSDFLTTLIREFNIMGFTSPFSDS